MTPLIDPDRFRFTRGGILNVWQYDDQVFTFGGGRLLLRGTNGAGKSKTLEMLLPFVLDGDKARMTASGKHHTSLLWLMTDGYAGSSRTGYLWVELTRPGDDGTLVTITCGVGIRASDSSRQATAWFFTSPRRVGEDLVLEDEWGPLSAQRCRAEVETDGHFFDSARRYRDHVGRLLFGLPPDQYDDLLRLLYWLRQPQVGEDIEPRRLAEQLVQALPQVDDGAVRAAGDTFDELEAFGEQIDRRDRAATAVAEFVVTYSGYARGVLRTRAAGVVEADRELRRRRSSLARSERLLETVETDLADGRAALAEAVRAQESARGRMSELEKGPEARAQQRLTDLAQRVADLDSAAKLAAQVAESARRRLADSDRRVQQAGTGVAADGGRLRDELAMTAQAMGEAGWSAPLVVPTGLVADPQAVPAVRAAAQGVGEQLHAARPVLGELQAAVLVVDQARLELDAARAAATAAESVVAGVEERSERVRSALSSCRERSAAAEGELDERLRAWQAADHAVDLVLPELTADALAELESIVRAAAAPVRAGHEEVLGVARAAVAAGEQRRAGLQQRRARIEAEVDPSPPEPAWHRDDRAGLSGAPFWRLVDWREGGPLSSQERAGLEAALEGSGLLDAWVQPDGRVLDTDHADLVLTLAQDEAAADDGTNRPVRSAAPRRSLADALRADGSGGSGVPAEVITALLDRVDLAQDRGPSALSSPEASLAAAAFVVSVDGRWRAGPMHGRTHKERAQYIGASARAAERERRLGELDRELSLVTDDIARAGEEREAAQAALAGLDTWLGARPRHEGVLQAWAALAAAELALEAVTQELVRVQAHAASARAAATERHTALSTLAAAHSLPMTAEGLGARREQLATIAARLVRHEDRLAALVARVEDWLDQQRRAEVDTKESRSRRDEAEQAAALAQRVGAEHDELRSAVGASVLALERRLADLRAEFTESATSQRRLQERLDALNESLGTQRTEVAAGRAALEDCAPRLDASRAALAELVDVPGLLTAGIRGGPAAAGVTGTRRNADAAGTRRNVDAAGTRRNADAAGADAATGLDEAALSQAEVDTARALAGLPARAQEQDANAVLKASQELQSGPAATLEPRVSEQHGVLAAIGREEAGEVPLVELAERLRRSVDADRELLTDRERRLFEDHVLGHLGDSLRSVRLKAEELVAAMNGLLQGVTTSQGISVRLRWRLRDDIPAEAKRAVQLLGEPLGALLPDEKRELRESLHRLIEVSRAEAPEDTYAEHLARALDYRQWFAFRIQYHRPEARDWLDLHRRSPLSQGEQKVLCYLPLFAAAAAHFTSVAGAAPHAPRFVLLDDAFPKIDIRTHPLLFGLLVDLDLDFVVTSERLWGDHATVPELAIYEALRSPHERGIAQYEHRWDGHQLRAVGA